MKTIACQRFWSKSFHFVMMKMTRGNFNRQLIALHHNLTSFYCIFRFRFQPATQFKEQIFRENEQIFGIIFIFSEDFDLRS